MYFIDPLITTEEEEDNEIERMFPGWNDMDGEFDLDVESICNPPYFREVKTIVIMNEYFEQAINLFLINKGDQPYFISNQQKIAQLCYSACDNLKEGRHWQAS